MNYISTEDGSKLINLNALQFINIGEITSPKTEYYIDYNFPPIADGEADYIRERFVSSADRDAKFRYVREKAK